MLNSSSQALSTTSPIDEAVARIRSQWSERPRVGVILGTGLGGLAAEIVASAVIPYSDLPHFPRSTALGHAGRLVCGTLDGVPVVAMDGRCHLYEGYSPEQVTLPVRVLHALGIECLVISNASGGLNPRLDKGDIVVVNSHVNLMGRRARFGDPARNGHREHLPGLRDDDASRQETSLPWSPYADDLVDAALAVARRSGFAAMRGTYVGVSGPNYETRAEYRFMTRIGGDVVGMSTIPEVLVASELGLRVLVLSIVTNVARPDVAPELAEHTTAASVVDAAAAAAANVCHIVRQVVANHH